eukprot:SAG31_NODE_33721_length_340_cov_1.493776_1_plen_26_part_10
MRIHGIVMRGDILEMFDISHPLASER